MKVAIFGLVKRIYTQKEVRDVEYGSMSVV